MTAATFRGPAGPVFAATTWRLPRDESWAIRGGSGAGKSLFVAALLGRLPRLSGSLEHPFLDGRSEAVDSVYGVLPPGTIALASMDQHRALVAAREFHQLRWHCSLGADAPAVASFIERDAVEGRNPFVIADDRGAERFEAARTREVERFALGKLLARPLLALSNGELHRLLLARAMMLDPGLLVVDEPFAGLDVRARGELTALLAELPASGTGVLYVAAREVDVPPGVTHELTIAAGAVVSAGNRATGRERSRPPSLAATTARGIPLPIGTRTSTAGGGGQPAVPVLELRGVTVRHGELTLLDGIDWTIYAGERWALVGPNGAGKSTLLGLVLADHPQAHANHVLVCGRRLGPGTSIWDLKRCTGWVSPELEAHYPATTTLADTVASGWSATLGVHGAVGAAERAGARRWLERLGLAGCAEDPLGLRPAVERRLALLARACVHEPSLLLLDEPCQGLDTADRTRFARALEVALETVGAALIYVSHEAEELPPGLQHRLELAAGRVVPPPCPRRT